MHFLPPRIYVIYGVCVCVRKEISKSDLFVGYITRRLDESSTREFHVCLFFFLFLMIFSFVAPETLILLLKVTASLIDHANLPVCHSVKCSISTFRVTIAFFVPGHICRKAPTREEIGSVAEFKERCAGF